jgi:hypothetical protein
MIIVIILLHMFPHLHFSPQILTDSSHRSANLSRTMGLDVDTSSLSSCAPLIPLHVFNTRLLLDKSGSCIVPLCLDSNSDLISLSCGGTWEPADTDCDVLVTWMILASGLSSRQTYILYHQAGVPGQTHTRCGDGWCCACLFHANSILSSIQSQFPMLHINHLFRPTVMCDSFASQYVRLESWSLHVTFMSSSSSSSSFYSY